MRSLVSAAIGVALLTSPLSASAEDHSGVYVGMAMGLSSPSDSSFGILGGAATVKSDYETGFFVAGTVGYDFGNVIGFGGFRTALEVNSWNSDIENHRVAALGGSQTGSKGTAGGIAVMFNGFFDVETGSFVRPYLGGGIGYSWNVLDNYGTAAIPTVLDDSDSGFAWQLIAGVGFDLNEEATIDIEYRYFSTSADVTTSAATGSTSSSVDLGTHSIMLGLRYRF